MDEDTEKYWFTAHRAAEVVSAATGDYASATNAIAIRLRDGLISAKAERVIQSRPSTLKSLLDVSRFSTESATDVRLSTSFWESKDYWTDVGRWNWRMGEMSISHFDGYTDSVTTAYGVKLFAPDILEMLPDEEVAPPTRENVPRGIQPEPKWNWEEPLIELLAVAESDNLVDTFELNKRGGQARLERWLEEWFERRTGGASPSITEVRKRASAIMRALPPV